MFPQIRVYLFVCAHINPLDIEVFDASLTSMFVISEMVKLVTQFTVDRKTLIVKTNIFFSFLNQMRDIR